jgi:hypothetical protein
MELAVTFKHLSLWEYSRACAPWHNDVCTVVSGQVTADGSKERQYKQTKEENGKDREKK